MAPDYLARARIAPSEVLPSGNRWGQLVGTGLLLAWTLPPFLYLVLLSVKSEALMVERVRLVFWPTLERYRDVVVSDRGTPVWTSLVTSTAGAVFAVTLASLAAVTFAFLDFRGKTASRLALKTLGLIDTRTALVILFTGFQIRWPSGSCGRPSARCPVSWPRARRSTGPLCRPSSPGPCCPRLGSALLAALILSFIFNWNEFLFPLIVTGLDAKTGSVVDHELRRRLQEAPVGSLAVLGA